MVKERAFTLIELLVVVAIIGLLASIVLVDLAEARSHSRDIQRVVALREIQKAIGLSYAENGVYPADPSQPDPEGLSCWQCSAGASYDSTALANKIGSFLKPRPCDPSLPGNNGSGGCPPFPSGSGQKGFFYKVDPNGTDYKIAMSRVVENLNHVPSSMSDPDYLTTGIQPDITISLYSSDRSRDWYRDCNFTGLFNLCNP